MSTITQSISNWACELKYDDLPAEAVEAAKRFLYDTLGCALGGYQTGDVKIFLRHLQELGSTGPCTIIGAGDKMNVLAASMLNALMVRAMDYNDIYWKQDPSHPSDLLSAPLAIAEWKHMTGKDLLLGIVIGYEITLRLCHIAVPGIRERGWHHATLMAYAAPVVAGKMIGLNPEQMQHAIGIAACHRFTLGCAVAGKLTMMKNTVSPMATRDGVEAALLAQMGYTGPEGVIEGKEGMQHCLGEGWDYSWLTDKLDSTLQKSGTSGGPGEGPGEGPECGTGVSPVNARDRTSVNNTGGTPVPQIEGHGFMITDCGMKSYPTEALTHSPITATLYLIKEHGLKAEDVKEVHIESISRAADILSDPSKYDPQSKETADHSLPYCIAVALAEGQVTPPMFKMEKIQEPRVRAQLNKVKVTANEEYEKAFPARQCTRVTLTTTDGRRLTRELDVPKGDPRDPMTPEELQVKFDALAEPVLSDKRRAALKDCVFSIETLDDVGKLMALTVSDR